MPFLLSQLKPYQSARGSLVSPLPLYKISIFHTRLYADTELSKTELSKAELSTTKIIMTYTDSTNFSTEASTQPFESESTTLKKLSLLKQESLQRSQRIAKIMRAAFSESTAEFKAGRTVISPLAKEVTAETVAVVKENGQKVSNTVSQVWQESEDDDDITERLIRFIRTLSASAREKLFPQLKLHTNRLDSFLSERYGDRYTSIRDRFDISRTGYAVTDKDVSNTAEAQSKAVPTIEVESEVIR